jgi:hypothetical protein
MHRKHTETPNQKPMSPVTVAIAPETDKTKEKGPSDVAIHYAAGADPQRLSIQNL